MRRRWIRGTMVARRPGSGGSRHPRAASRRGASAGRAARLAPALRLVAEAGEERLRLHRRTTDRPGQQVTDAFLKDLVGR